MEDFSQKFETAVARQSHYTMMSCLIKGIISQWPFWEDLVELPEAKLGLTTGHYLKCMVVVVGIRIVKIITNFEDYLASPQ